MAVQKSKVTRSKRDMRRNHDRVTMPTVATDKETGERHRRHHVTADGFYRGRQVIDKKIKVTDQDQEDEE